MTNIYINQEVNSVRIIAENKTVLHKWFTGGKAYCEISDGVIKVYDGIEGSNHLIVASPIATTLLIFYPLTEDVYE